MSDETQVAPSHTAYLQMIHKIPIVEPEWTLEHAHRYFTQNASDFESIRYLYVVDDVHRLIGIMSLKDIFRHEKKKTVGQVCKKKDLVFVSPDTPQEKVVYLALQHNIKAIPVVDESGILLGIVPSDKILSILYKETRKDLLHLVGLNTSEVHLENILSASIFKSFEHRIPWLLVGMVGGIVSASIISSFEKTLETNVLLAAFIPLIVYMSNAVAMQVQTLYIRDLASLHNLPIERYFLKQFGASFLVSLTVSSLLFAVLVFLQITPLYLATVVAVSMFLTVNSAVFLAMALPWFFKKIRTDPALGSGPVSTIIQDTTSVIIYFLLATLLLR